ncbi:unnamed protein product [Arctia plantaginis]|uniref:Uncharacterized protein n=1 Tax=Arctia plantaginis TaxID=874455 RepID=A0A8S1BD84_ARCPL|nr:unnamed protein product [Arctia plantaginis]
MDVTTALNRLFELVKEGESKKKGPEILVQEETTEEKETEKKLKEVIMEHARSIQEHTQKMRDLEKAFEEQKKENSERRKKLATNEVLIEAGKRRVAVALLQEPYVGAAKKMRSHQGVRIFQNANHGEGTVKAVIAVFDPNLKVKPTPAKKAAVASPGAASVESAKAGPSTSPAHPASPSPNKSPNKIPPSAPLKLKFKNPPPETRTVTTRRASTEVLIYSPPAQKIKNTSRTAEAKALVTKAKILLGQSGNIRKDIKSEVTVVVEKLYKLVKEGENKKRDLETTPQDDQIEETDREEKLGAAMRDHTRAIQEHIAKKNDLEKALEAQMKERTGQESTTSYAQAVASHTTNTQKTPIRSTMHSMVVTSREETETGEEVLNKVRQVVNAKEGWIKVERVRKAKDRKVILGFGSKE